MEELQRVVADPVIRNREIAKLYAFAPLVGHPTTARRLPGGVEAWDREVGAQSPEFAERVRAALAE